MNPGLPGTGRHIRRRQIWRLPGVGTRFAAARRAHGGYTGRCRSGDGRRGPRGRPPRGRRMRCAGVWVPIHELDSFRWRGRWLGQSLGPLRPRPDAIFGGAIFGGLLSIGGFLHEHTFGFKGTEIGSQSPPEKPPHRVVANVPAAAARRRRRRFRARARGRCSSTARGSCAWRGPTELLAGPPASRPPARGASRRGRARARTR
jgi:hypothetical protein